MIKSVFVVTAIILLFGCASGIRFNKEYSNIDFSMKHVSITIPDSLTFNYSGSMDNEFPEENRSEMIKQFIADDVVAALRDSSAFLAQRIEQSYCDDFVQTSLRWTDSVRFEIMVPADECPEVPDSNQLWLFIERPTITSNTAVQLVMVGFVPVMAVPHKPLQIASRFVYWDPAAKKAVAWGKASGTYDSGQPAVTMEHWKKASRSHAFSMIRKSPFARDRAGKQ